jgi:hypothetical protein
MGTKMQIRDKHPEKHISERLVTMFVVKNTPILCCGSGIRFLFDLGSGIRYGMEKSESGISDPG